MYTYPDVAALCGEPEFDRSSRPAMSTESTGDLRGALAFHRRPSTGAKSSLRYRALKSLTDYVLVAADSMHVEHFTLAADRAVDDDRISPARRPRAAPLAWRSN